MKRSSSRSQQGLFRGELLGVALQLRFTPKNAKNRRFSGQACLSADFESQQSCDMEVNVKNILDQLAEYAVYRTKEAKKHLPMAEIEKQALYMGKGDFSFEKALQKPELSFICECKKASPSKGLIAPDFPYLEIARQYESAGADAISVLTEPKWFLGSDEYLREIAEAAAIPCLRKDFTVDAYMIYEAKLLGASAVLLICSLLDEGQIKEYQAICDSLGLSALVEAHDEAEVEMAIRAGARVIGVNNRNLKDFTVDTENSRRLREKIPESVTFVSESGVSGPEDVRKLAEIGVDAVLVGEALMRAKDKKQMLSNMREINNQKGMENEAEKRRSNQD